MNYDPENFDLYANLLVEATAEDGLVGDFVDAVIAKIKANRLHLKVSLESTISMGGARVNGYFLASTCTLGIAIGKPVREWAAILLHEVAHMTQYLANPAKFAHQDQASEALFAWLEGTRTFAPTEVQALKTTAMDLESECEVITNTLIKLFDLKAWIDPTEHAQKANAYVAFYHYAVRNRAWYIPGREPYNRPEVWMCFPDEIVRGGMPDEPWMDPLFHDCVFQPVKNEA